MSGRILIVDDVPTNRMVLRVKLSAARYETMQATCGEDGLSLARKMRPDLILLDVMLPDVNGLDVCRALRADPVTAQIPVIIVTSCVHPAERIAAFRAGADDVLSRPFDDLVLLARMRSLLRSRDPSPAYEVQPGHLPEFALAEDEAPFQVPSRIAFVTGAEGEATALPDKVAHLLRDKVSRHAAANVLDEWERFAAPDLFVIPADIAGHGDGLLLMSELRSRPSTRNAAICVIADPGARETLAMALDLGAHDVIPHSASPEEIALRLRAQCRRKRHADRMRNSFETGLRLSLTDPLTGLHNRRYALPHLARIARDGQPFAVILLDIDHFKAVNDTYGHTTGDAVLIDVAQRLRGRLRSVDLVSRFGGEEFLVALPNCGLDAARATAERLRAAIGDAPIRLASGQNIVVTVSAGLALCPHPCSEGEAVEQIIDRADRALLTAKAEGRNQVTIFRSAA